MTDQTSHPNQADRAEDNYRLTAARHTIAERERELLELKGRCSPACRLHYAHAGPCDTRTIPTDAERTKADDTAPATRLDASTPTTQPCCTLAALTHHAKHATGCLGVALNAIDRRLSRLEDRVDEHLMEPEYDPADDDQAEPTTAERLATTAQAARDVADELARTEDERDRLVETIGRLVSLPPEQVATAYKVGYRTAGLGSPTPRAQDQGEVTVEYGVRLRFDDGRTIDQERGTIHQAEQTVALHAERRRAQPGWQATAELIRRTITTGPWEPATADQAGADERAEG